MPIVRCRLLNYVTKRNQKFRFYEEPPGEGSKGFQIYCTTSLNCCSGFWVVSEFGVFSNFQECCVAVLHSQLKDQYASLRVVVEESLTLNVHVDQLQDAKRTVRDLRRQYGHRLVDQKEFSQDPLNESVEELQQV